MPARDAAYRNERARFRRRMDRGAELSASEDHLGAFATYRDAQAMADHLFATARRPRVLADLVEASRLMGESARRAGARPDAVAAFRACHAYLNDLIELEPGESHHQADLTRINAALRDTLREADDTRLALAAARLAAASARTLLDQWPDDAEFAADALQHRLILAKMLRAEGRLDEAAAAYDEAATSWREGSRSLADAPGVWDFVKRAHLDLADLEQSRHRFDPALAVLDSLRSHLTRRLSKQPKDTRRLTDAAQERYLTGLVLNMKEDADAAFGAFSLGLDHLDAIEAGDVLSAAVQQQRGRLIAHAAQTGIAEPGSLEARALTRLRRLAAEAPKDSRRQHNVMAHAYDLARTLIDKDAAALAVPVIAFAGEVLRARHLNREDQLYVSRWSAFLELERGRALRACGDVGGAVAAFHESLAINDLLGRDDPGDVRAQCDGAYADWQIGLLSLSERRQRLRRARAVLALLDRGGRLPAFAAPWMNRIDRDLAAG